MPTQDCTREARDDDMSGFMDGSLSTIAHQGFNPSFPVQRACPGLHVGHDWALGITAMRPAVTVLKSRDGTVPCSPLMWALSRSHGRSIVCKSTSASSGPT